MKSHGLFIYNRSSQFLFPLFYKRAFLSLLRSSMYMAHHDCRPWTAIFYWYQINSFMLKKKKKKSSSLFVDLFRSTFWWPLWDQRTVPHTHQPKVLGLMSKRVVSTIEFIVTHCFLTDPGVWRHIFLLDPRSHTFVFRALPILFEIHFKDLSSCWSHCSVFCIHCLLKTFDTLVWFWDQTLSKVKILQRFFPK